MVLVLEDVDKARQIPMRSGPHLGNLPKLALDPTWETYCNMLQGRAYSICSPLKKLSGPLAQPCPLQALRDPEAQLSSIVVETILIIVFSFLFLFLFVFDPIPGFLRLY